MRESAEARLQWWRNVATVLAEIAAEAPGHLPLEEARDQAMSWKIGEHVTDTLDAATAAADLTVGAYSRVAGVPTPRTEQSEAPAAAAVVAPPLPDPAAWAQAKPQRRGWGG